MTVNLKLHNFQQIIKSTLGTTEYLFNRFRLHKNELIVINYHGTQKIFLPNFKKQLFFFQQNFSIISPEQLPLFYSNNLRHENKPLLLLTFDDGIKNNLYAAEILNDMKITAIFFIIPEFIDTPFEQQKIFFINNVRPLFNPEIDKEQEDFSSMSWDDIKLLQKFGHIIGSHTQTHTLVAKTSSIENSTLEICNSKHNIANQLQVSSENINAFCSINNTLESVSEKELQLIKSNYKYHFTTLPGPNFNSSSPLFIKRSNIEVHWLLGAVKYAIGKWDLKRWDAKNNEYSRRVEEISNS